MATSNLSIVLAGGSGFLGTHLRTELVARGHAVTSLVRRPACRRAREHVGPLRRRGRRRPDRERRRRHQPGRLTDARQPALEEVGPRAAREPSDDDRGARRRHRGRQQPAGLPRRQRHLLLRRPRRRRADRGVRHPRARPAHPGDTRVAGGDTTGRGRRRAGVRAAHLPGHGPTQCAAQAAAPCSSRPGWAAGSATASSSWRCRPCATGSARSCTWPSTRTRPGPSTSACPRHRPTRSSRRRWPRPCTGGRSCRCRRQCSRWPPVRWRPELLGSLNVRPAALENVGYMFHDPDVQSVLQVGLTA